MVPSWVINFLVVFFGSIFAIYLGASLPEYDLIGAYLLACAIIFSICVVSNNFPLLMAMAVWVPIAPPLPIIRSFPTTALVISWFAVLIFFRICLTRSLNYVPSANLFLLICFLWVPIRFMLNPVEHLGSQVSGGHGVSGIFPYFYYGLAGVALVAIGAILNSKDKILEFYLWSYRWCMIFGVILLACAFLPFTWGYLIMMGMFAAGTMTDGILRIVNLPGYGLVLIQAALCPALFRLNRMWAYASAILGTVMMVVGGNRSALAAALVAIPITFFLQRKFHLLVVCTILFATLVLGLHLAVDQMSAGEIPSLFRCLGIFDSKIDEATGGSASAAWRYAVWDSGMKKIMESPLIGKGYGHLDQRFETDTENTTDFESILAGGEAHNGFVSAAYGFGIPFMLALSLALIYRMFVHMSTAYNLYGGDKVMRDFHCFIGATFSTAGVLVYTAFDLSVTYFWIYVGTGIAMGHIVRAERNAKPLVPIEEQKVGSAKPSRLYPGTAIR